MGRNWLVNASSIAKKVRNASRSSGSQIKDCGANCECPNCHYVIDNSNLSQEWPGLPAGVKFDPSDEHLIQHLAAKCGIENSKPAHAFIDEFIPTIECNEGICYTHPENLPGAKMDGSSIHFFHRTTNAYSKGPRKRRKICTENRDDSEINVRWHKTGRSTPIMENGVLKGYRKIMVLYKSSKKCCNQVPSNWKMYQYHLGTDQCEENGQYVVSKIFYDVAKKKNKDDETGNNSPRDNNAAAARTSPRTPNNPCLGVAENKEKIDKDDIINNPYDYVTAPRTGQKGDPSINLPKDDNTNIECQCLAGESQLPYNVGLDQIEDSLLCKEAIESLSQVNTTVDLNQIPPVEISELEQFDFGTPPDFLLHNEWPFGSQESIFDWLDRL